MKKLIFTLAFAPVLALSANDNVRDNFLKQQAYAEMTRVTGEVDALQRNLQDLERRIGETQRLKAELDQLRQEVALLRSQLAEQTARQASDREALINDLTKKISRIQRDSAPTPTPSSSARRTPPVSYNGPVGELTVESGDTLSTIARGCGTTVAIIKAINNLKSDNLRIGQVLKVPMK